MRWLAADWVLPVDAPPIREGAVLIDDHGRIAAVAGAAALPPPERAECHDLGAVALMPGLVNTHTHLELTGLAGSVTAERFIDWIVGLVAVKGRRSEEEFFLAACEGIRDQWRAGVTTVCDTGSTGSVIAALDHLGASGVAHHEVFGDRVEDAPAAARRFDRELADLARHAVGRARLGVAPHAPYTVSGPLYRASAELARAHGAPIAVHVAEPADESALLRDFTGSFAEWWRHRGIPRPSEEAVTPVEWLDRHGVLSERTLCVHAIHADRADAELMVRAGAAVAHCPRSNRVHHHADAPVAMYRELGLRIGLGTDSEVSVAPTDLLAEARAGRRLAGWSADETLHALTLGGAGAIGLAAEIGSLAPGKHADLVAMRFEGDDPVEGVLAASRNDVVTVWLGGRPVT